MTLLIIIKPRKFQISKDLYILLTMSQLIDIKPHTPMIIAMSLKNMFVNFNGSNYATKKIEHANNTINNTTGHINNNFEHNVIKKSQTFQTY